MKDRTNRNYWIQISPPRSRLGPLNLNEIQKHHLNKLKTLLEEAKLYSYSKCNTLWLQNEVLA